MKFNVKSLARSGMLLAVAVVIQFIGRNVPQVSQFLVGPVVNAVLLLAVFVSGTWWGVLIGALTPITAWLVGQLPTPMGPFIPFIIIGNIIYVVFFGLLYNRGSFGKYAGYILGSVLKFLFMYVSAVKLIFLFQVSLPQKVAAKLAVMMGMPQLVTALIGGAVALIIIEMLKKRRVEFDR